MKEKILFMLIPSIIFFILVSINSIGVSFAQEICSLTVSNNLDFLPLNPGEISQDTTTVLTNHGNLEITDIRISATDWSTTFPASQSHYSLLSDQDYQTGMRAVPTSPSDESIGEPTPPFLLAVENTQSVYFKLKIPDNQPAGDYSQTITFTFGCGVDGV